MTSLLASFPYKRVHYKRIRLYFILSLVLVRSFIMSWYLFDNFSNPFTGRQPITENRNIFFGTKHHADTPESGSWLISSILEFSTLPPPASRLQLPDLRAGWAKLPALLYPRQASFAPPPGPRGLQLPRCEGGLSETPRPIGALTPLGNPIAGRLILSPFVCTCVL